MPWKSDQDPYKIWLSEIILQQTRVSYGMGYFNKIVQRFPTVRALAEAEEDELLSLWKGLGYYSRARNLHFAAKQVVEKFGGEFPKNYEDILSLKGVGPYSAAAIGSFAFDLPYAVLDGNVFRVLSRFFGIDTPIDTSSGKKEFQQLAQSCLDQSSPGAYNQAIMDFGALVCLPKGAKCDICPISNTCMAALTDSVGKLPIKSKSVRVRERKFHFLVIRKGQQLLMQKRTDKDIWKGLYQMPLIESTNLLDTVSLKGEIRKKWHLTSDQDIRVEKLVTLNQRLTHQKITGTFFDVGIERRKLDGQWFSQSELEHIGLPKIIDDFIRLHSIFKTNDI